MSERDNDDDEPEDSPVPPTSTPPNPDVHVPDSPVPPLVQAILESLRPTFEGIQNEFTKYEQRMTGQQTYIENLAANLDKTIEDRVIRAVRVMQEAQPEYLNPAATSQYAPQPTQGGIGGFIQQIMGFVTSPQGQQLLTQTLGGGGSDAIFKQVYAEAHSAFDKSLIRNFARVAALPEIVPNESAVVHAVIGSH